MRCTCSFDHYPNGDVFFISRYREQNDYCIDGRRVRLLDDGTTNATSEERRKLGIFLLREYAEYAKWHAEIPYRGVPLQPFDHPELLAEVKSHG